MSIKNSEIVPIKCPDCGKEILKSFGWLESNDEIVCDLGCGNTFETKSIVTGLNEAAQYAEDTARNLINDAKKKNKF